ncbi:MULTISPECIES: ArsR/SmtB family transcription factor [Haloarcula]|uniref:ArsR/SmtB family transcription factor n=1 Tax=Haloarcula TaxID=2237 RepID=UPI0023EBD455|nr:helix-turn-helix domain-containing protein [Halomicroarcula sp. XH51]
MASALPHRPAVDYTPTDRTDVEIRDDDTGDIIQAMSSAMAQDLLAALDDEPSTASGLADAVGASLQNTKYHLDQLCEAGLVEGVDTWYSSRGAEMTVYALSIQRLVVRLGETGHDGTSDRTGE